MKPVTFAKDYRHRVDALTTVNYLAGRTYPVTADVAAGARKAGALKKERSRGSAD